MTLDDFARLAGAEHPPLYIVLSEAAMLRVQCEAEQQMRLSAPTFRFGCPVRSIIVSGIPACVPGYEHEAMAEAVKRGAVA